MLHTTKLQKVLLISLLALLTMSQASTVLSAPPYAELVPFQLIQSSDGESNGPSWVQRFPANHPSAITSYDMAYDSGRGVTVLFGGYNGSVNLDDTWEWDGTNWLRRTPLHHPSARTAPAMAYDSARSVVVLFGGYIGGNPPTYSSETWEWDGTDWTERNPANYPSARVSSLVYDSARHVSVLFGGSDGNLPLNDTWEWDGTDWAKRSPVDQPPVRISPGMAYDSARGVTVLFGGYTGSGFDRLDDTWEWDGTNWIKRTPATYPSARSSHAIAYDSEREVTVLFGGSVGSNGLDDTWEWDGTNWIERTPVEYPTARYSHAMAFDSARGVIVLFGGVIYPCNGGYCYGDDTWEYGLWHTYLPLVVR